MKKVLVILLIVMSSVFILGCNQENESFNFDVLTQKSYDQNEINITVMTKHAFSIDVFEKIVEEEFPNVNIIQVGNYSYNMGIDEYEARIKNDDLTDIVMTWPIDVGEEYWDDRLLDLSTFSYTNNYTTKSLNGISFGDEGKLYYLPGPSQIRGIVYNKTLFKNNGWTVPNNYEEFVTLCNDIEAKGIRALQLGFGNTEVLDTALTGFSYGDCYAKPTNLQALEDYNNGKGSFGDNFKTALENFQDLIDDNIIRESDLGVFYQDREKMLFDKEPKCAMVEDSVLMTGMGESMTGTTDEFGLMPFFNQGEYNDWARLYPVCFIGLNKHLEDKGNEVKFNAVQKIMEFISTPEGQEALIGANGTMFSNLKGVSVPTSDATADLEKSLKAGRYGVFSTLKNAQSALRQGLTLMLKKEASIDDVIEMVDNQNLNPQVAEKPKKLSVATETFTLAESSNFFADVMRQYTGAEIALFMDNGKDGLTNGKGLSGRIYKGDFTEKDLKRLFPDSKFCELNELITVKMTGENLINTLEYSIPIFNKVSGWFYYFSGLKVEFNPLAPPGQRIKKVTDSNDNAIDKNRIYSIAVIDGIVKNEYITDTVNHNTTVLKLIRDTITESQTISPSKDDRFKIVIS